MIAFLLSPIGRLVIAGAIGAAVGAGAAWRIQAGRLDTLRAEYEQFRGGVAALGDQAKAKAAQIEAENALKKGKADAENAKTRRNLDDVYAAYRKLRDSRAGSGIGLVPPSAPGAASTASATFDRTSLDRGLSDFDRGVTALLERGDQAIADMNSTRAWAQSPRTP